MKLVRLLTKSLFFSIFLFSFSALAADTGQRPNRDLDDARRPVAGDQKPGSVLFFNIYTSSPSNHQADTELSLTNVNATESAFVHLFFVAEGCSVADSFVCLTPNQTASFLASDVDPGITGYIIAIASDRLGRPLSFNYLIGGEHVKFASGHAASLGAESYSALFNGVLPGVEANAVSATMAFDGVRYNAAPRQVALDHFRSPAEGNSTMLILNRFGGSLAVGAATLGSLLGVLYDDVENAFSFQGRGGCQLRVLFSDDFPATTPKLSQAIPAGRMGWLRLMTRDEEALTGAVINFNPGAATDKRGAFNGGRNLHHLRFGSATFTKPVFPPSC